MAKTTLVTGANRGIGLALCQLLRQRGDEVVAVCRTSSPELDALGVDVVTGVEVTSDESVAKLDYMIQWIRGHQDPFEAYLENRIATMTPDHDFVEGGLGI